MVVHVHLSTVETWAHTSRCVSTNYQTTTVGAWASAAVRRKLQLLHGYEVYIVRCTLYAVRCTLADAKAFSAAILPCRLADDKTT